MWANKQQLPVCCSGRREPNDPFFMNGDRVCHAWSRQGVFEIEDEDSCHNVIEEFSCNESNCMETFTSLYQYELHYNGSHRFTCSECQKQLPCAFLLDIHLSELHDTYFQVQAERKPMYQCLVQSCKTMSRNAEERLQHCIDVHQYPRNFLYFNLLKKKKAPKNKAKLAIQLEPDTDAGISASPTTLSFAKGCRKRKTEWFQQDADTSSKRMEIDISLFVKDLLDSLPEINT